LRSLVIFALVIAGLYTIIAVSGTWTPKLGLDLRGGSTITLTASNSTGTGQVDAKSLELARTIIQQRVDGYGVGESEVTTSGDRQIVVSVPNVQKDDLVRLVGTTAQLFFIGIGAVIYTKFLALSGSATLFTELVGTWALNPMLLVIAVSAIYLVLGMFLDPLGMILLTIPVFVPMFAALNLDLVWFGVLVVKYIGIGLLTPPVGFNIYVVSGALNNQIPLQTIFRGCYWFLLCEAVIMTLLIAFPQISLWLPSSMN